jgi:hypothetical protein
LPYTLPQDFTLFILMREKDTSIWKRKLEWIAEKGGMALLNVHPDYLNFDGRGLGKEEYPASYYRGFLEFVKQRFEGIYWHALPCDVARFMSRRESNRRRRRAVNKSGLRESADNKASGRAL